MTEERERAAAGGRAAEGSVEIAASVEAVWGALTNAAELERSFPVEARVQPGEGGSIYMSWKNEKGGRRRGRLPPYVPRPAAGEASAAGPGAR